MIDIGVATHPQTGAKVVLIQPHPEPIGDVVKLLRMLKMNFPEQWDVVQTEITLPRGNGLILPGGANGHRREDGLAAGDTGAGETAEA